MNDTMAVVVCQDQATMDFLRQALGEEGLAVDMAPSAAEGLPRVQSEQVKLLVTDARLPDVHGLDFLRQARSLRPELPVIIVADGGSIHDAVYAIKLGAFDYMVKPLRRAQLHRSVTGALNNGRAATAPGAERPESRRAHLRGLVTADYRMMRICDTLLSVADSSATVLIEGESGTGKTLVARLLHDNSARREGPFVEVNCAAMPEGLLETELFGHVRGAFTSAHAHRAGKIEAADGGTLLLDEIANASPALQMRLLRVIETFEFEPVGGVETRKVDVRLVAATNRSLDGQVAEGRFRADLLHRLNVVRVCVPPLRERVQDIPLLAAHFAATIAQKYGRPARKLSRDAMQRLVRYAWPGNVRELRNAVEHGVIMAAAEEISVEDLPMWLTPGAENYGGSPAGARTLKEALVEPERRLILGALRRTRWNKHLTARKLGVSRSTLYAKIKEYGLEGEEQ